jgi:hypothetical protein
MIILFGIFIYPLLQAFSQEGTLITYSYFEKPLLPFFILA